MFHDIKSFIYDWLQSCQQPVQVSNHKAIIMKVQPYYANYLMFWLRIFTNLLLFSTKQLDVVWLGRGFSWLGLVFERYIVNSVKVQTRIGRVSAGTILSETSNNVLFFQNFLNSLMYNSEKKNDVGLYLTSKLMFIHKGTSILPLPLCVTFRNKVFFPPHLMIENDILFSIDILLLFNLTEEADQKIGQLNLHYIKSIYPDIELPPINWGALVLQLAHVAMELKQSSGTLKVLKVLRENLSGCC